MPHHPSVFPLRRLRLVILVILHCLNFIIPMVAALSTRLSSTKRSHRHDNILKCRFPCCPATATCIRLTNDVEENTDLRFLKDETAVWTKYTDYGDLPYESALRVLKAYHEGHGNLVIPRGFVVPSSDGENDIFINFNISFWIISRRGRILYPVHLLH